jgi:hypothetical protein
MSSRGAAVKVSGSAGLTSYKIPDATRAIANQCQTQKGSNPRERQTTTEHPTRHVAWCGAPLIDG